MTTEHTRAARERAAALDSANQYVAALTEEHRGYVQRGLPRRAAAVEKLLSDAKKAAEQAADALTDTPKPPAKKPASKGRKSAAAALAADTPPATPASLAD